MADPLSASAVASSAASGPQPGTAVAAPGRRRLGVAAWIAIGWLVVVVGAAVLAPVLPLPDYAVPDIEARNQAEFNDNMGPIEGHPLGMDDQGRDTLSRVVWGARSSLLLAVITVGGAFLVGGTLGMAGGYFGGRADRSITGLLDIMLAFPSLVLAIAIVGFLGDRSLWKLAIALGIVATPLLGRITRASAMNYTQREFVTAARALGGSHRRIMVRELLPNVLPALFAVAMLALVLVIVGEGLLSILDIGLPGPEPSWGLIIAENRGSLRTNPWPVLVTVTVLLFTVMALQHLGDLIRERSDIREGGL